MLKENVLSEGYNGVLTIDSELQNILDTDPSVIEKKEELHNATESLHELNIQLEQVVESDRNQKKLIGIWVDENIWRLDLFSNISVCICIEYV